MARRVKVPEALRGYARTAREQRWRIAVVNGHLNWYDPDGKLRVRTVKTPSGGNRSIENTKKDLQKAGLTC